MGRSAHSETDLTTYGGRPLEAEPIIHVVGKLEFEGITWNVECHDLQVDLAAGGGEDSRILLEQCSLKSAEYEAGKYTRDWYTRPKAFTFTFPRGLPRRTMRDYLARVLDGRTSIPDYFRQFLEDN